eukprot:6914775-Lingulodinium_polyedra.AAC.1
MLLPFVSAGRVCVVDRCRLRLAPGSSSLGRVLSFEPHMRYGFIANDDETFFSHINEVSGPQPVPGDI